MSKLIPLPTDFAEEDLIFTNSELAEQSESGLEIHDPDRFVWRRNRLSPEQISDFIHAPTARPEYGEVLSHAELRRAAITKAVAMASMCWSEIPQGVYDSDSAVAIVDALVSFLG